MRKVLLGLVGIVVTVSILFAGCAPAAAPSPGGADCSEYEKQIDDLEKELAEAKKAAPAAEAEYEWKFGCFFPPDAFIAQCNQNFVHLVNGMSGGRIHVEYCGMGILGDNEENLDSISRGELELGIVSPYSGFHELQNVKGLPFAGSRYDTVDKLFYGDSVLKQIVDDSWEYIGCKALASVEDGILFYINNTRPLVTPDDFAGLKFRIPPSDVYVKTFERMCPEGIGEPIPWGEYYTSLERGVVDGGVCFHGVYEAYKFNEVAKYATDVNQMYNWNNTLINLDLWNSLPADLQDVLLAAGEASQKYCRFLYREGCAQVEESTTAAGAVWTHLTPEQRQVFIDNVNPEELYEELYRELLDKYYPGQGMYKKLADAVAAAG